MLNDNSLSDLRTVDETELKKILGRLNDRTLFAIFTDRCDFVKEVTDGDAGKLLELRAFNEESEFYAKRSLVGRDFVCRYINDGKPDYNGNGEPENDETRYYEAHFLDIDETYTKDGVRDGDMFRYKSMTGGYYHLPIQKARKIVICNYITYDNGEYLAQVTDYRYVKLLGGEV